MTSKNLLLDLFLVLLYLFRTPSGKGFVPVKIRSVAEKTFGWFNFFHR